jgi:hypothetical protein
LAALMSVLSLPARFSPGYVRRRPLTAEKGLVIVPAGTAVRCAGPGGSAG